MGRTKAPKTQHLLKEISAVLSAAGKALHYEDIARRIKGHAVFKEFRNSPAKAVYRAIYNDMNLHPDGTAFVKAGLGVYGLKSRKIKQPTAFVGSFRVVGTKPKARSIPRREDLWTDLMVKHSKSQKGGICEIPVWADTDNRYGS